jgi:hypothetical protein
MGTSLLALEIYQYTSLRPVDSTFRLLKLLKYQGPELECELFQQSLLNDEYTPYEALSYVWGSNELVECIILDRKRLWVTDSLYSALQCLRLRDRDRFLWIDAICINQADKEEQSQQVRQMGTIFKLAEGVLFWLGKATSEITTLMEALHQLQRAGAAWDLEQSMPDSGRLNDYRTGLRQLLNRQWFTRVWILQEVANAQKATVCCGIWSIPANVFAQAPSILGVEPESHCQAVLDIMPGTSRSGSWWGQERDLYALLCRFQASKATDERDKIYALLGLSSNLLDIGSIDIDYQQPTYKVIHKAITYLLQSTPIPIHETLNLMKSFATLDTIYFVLAVREKEVTEIIFPHLQTGEKLSRSQTLENTSQGMAIVNNPSLLLLEKRTKRNLKNQETCYSEVVKIMLDVRTATAHERQEYDDGLQVIPWGSIEQHVKLVVIHDRKRAILKAALQSCGHIVNKLLHMDIGGETRESLEESVLQEAITQGHKMAIETILQQSSHVHIQNGMYNNLLQEAARQSNHNSQEIMALLLDQRGDEVPITQEVVVAAAGNRNGKDIIALLLDRRGDKIQITQEVVVAAAGNRNGKNIIALLLDRRGDEIQITQEVVAKAAENYYGKDIIALLLNQRGDEVPITQEVVAAAAGNDYGGKDIIALLLDRRGDEIQITQEVVAAATGNLNGEDIMALLLVRRGDEVPITQEAVVSIAQRFDKKIMALLLDRRGDEIQITQEVVAAAAGNTHGERVIEYLHQVTSIDITDAVIQSAATSGKENTLRLFDQWAQASIVARHWIDIARLCTAAKKGDAKAVLGFIQQGVPPDKRDIRDQTPLWHAATKGHTDTVRVLLETNAVDINAADISKRTPLFWPSANGYTEVVRLLLNYGAQQNYEDADGRSPLEIARFYERPKVVEILVDNNI